MMTKHIQIGRPVDQADCWWVTHLTARLGPARAAKEIGVTRGTLAAVIAGLPVASSTEERVRSARLSPGDGPPPRAA